MVSRRDFVLVSTYEKNEDGSFNLVFVSIDDPKIKSEVVRAEVIDNTLLFLYKRHISMVRDYPQQINLINVRLVQWR